MKKSVKDQTVREFQVGGYNPPSVPQSTQPYAQPTPVNPQTGTYTLPGTGISGYQVPSGQQTGYTPYGGVAPVFVPTQFTGPQYQTALQTTNLPTFAETVGSKAGQYDEFRTYVNDAGQTLQIPFKDGKPIYPIPEGYNAVGEQPAPEEQTTVTPTVGTTTVTDEGGGDRDSGYTVGGVDYGSAANATQANEDMFGITGNSGINIAAVTSILMGNPLGAAASVSGYMGTPATAFGKEPEPGTGALTPAQLGLAQIGQLPIGSYTTKQGVVQGPLSQDQIAARMEAMSNLGVTMTGSLGYSRGDAIPGIPGAVMGLNGVGMMKDGTVAKDQFGVPVFDSFKSWFGYLTMTEEEREAQRAREAEIGKARSEYADAVTESQTTDEAYDGGIESMADAVKDGRDPTGTAAAFDKDGEVGMGDEYEGPSAPDAADVGGPPGTPGEPGFSGAAPGGAPEGSGMGGGIGGYGGDPSEGGADAGRAKGGLIDKQMKRSGLASKK